MAPPRDQSHMELALVQAQQAASRGEVPVGAVIVSPGGDILASAGNRTREQNDPTAHAEIVVIRAACEALNSQRLIGCDLFVTLEPCAMCAAAISFARISRLYYAASDKKGGAVEHGPRFFSQPTCHFRPEIYSGIAEDPAAALLLEFFKQRR